MKTTKITSLENLDVYGSLGNVHREMGLCLLMVEEY